MTHGQEGVGRAGWLHSLGPFPSVWSAGQPRATLNQAWLRRQDGETAGGVCWWPPQPLCPPHTPSFPIFVSPVLPRGTGRGEPAPASTPPSRGCWRRTVHSVLVVLRTRPTPLSASAGGGGGPLGRSHSLRPVLCLQEPDQVYEGITFDDFLKVGALELGVGMGAALGPCTGPCWSGRDRRLEGTGSSLSVAFTVV